MTTSRATTEIRLPPVGRRSRSGTMARRAKMPPSPRLSARMINVRYFTVTTIVSDQKMSDSKPKTSSRTTPWPWLVWRRHSRSV